MIIFILSIWINFIKYVHPNYNPCLSGSRSALAHLASIHRNRYTIFYLGTIATDSYLNSSLFATYSFAFNYSKNSSSSFAVALSIKGVNILFESASAANRGRYSVLVKLYSATSSGLSVVASTLLPNNNI